METISRMNARQWFSAAIAMIVSLMGGGIVYAVFRVTDTSPLALSLPVSVVRHPLTIVVDGAPWEPAPHPQQSRAGGSHQLPLSDATPMPTPVQGSAETWKVDTASPVVTVDLLSPKRVIEGIEHALSDKGPFGDRLGPLVRAELGDLVTSYERRLVSFAPDGRLLVAALKLGAVRGTQLIVDFHEYHASVVLRVPRDGGKLLGAFLRALIQSSSRHASVLSNGDTIIEARLGRTYVTVVETNDSFLVGSSARAVARVLVTPAVREQRHGVTGDLVVTLHGEGRFGEKFLRAVTGSDRYHVSLGIDLFDPSHPGIHGYFPPARLFAHLSRPVPVSLMRSTPHDIAMAMLTSLAMPLGATPAQWLQLAKAEALSPEPRAAEGVGLLWDIGPQGSVAGISVAMPSGQPSDGGANASGASPEPFWRPELPRGTCAADMVQIYASTAPLYQSMRESCDGASTSVASALNFTPAERASQLLVVVQPRELLAGILSRGSPDANEQDQGSTYRSPGEGSARSDQEERRAVLEDLLPLTREVIAMLPSLVFSGNRAQDGSVTLTGHIKGQQSQQHSK